MDATKMEEEEEAMLLFVPVPGMGHLVPMVELAKRLLHLRHSHRFAVAILNIPPLHPSPQLTAYISSVAASGLPISFHDLPHVDLPAAAIADKAPEVLVTMFLDLCKPHVKSAMESIMGSSSAVVAVVVDFFCSAFIDVAHELGIAPYVFFTSGAAMLGLMLRLPVLRTLLPDDSRGLELEEVRGMAFGFPGFALPLPLLALPDPILGWKGETFDCFADHGRRFLEAKGIIINTFAELEGTVVKALEDGLYVPDRPTPPVYPVGPVLSVPSEGGGKHECVRWLDGQPKGSVVFLCFGSMGGFHAGQAREIALGLERSGHRFLWVLRSPGSGNLCRTTDAVLDEVLPDGFVRRTKGIGMVWPSFCPQMEILSHDAVGGFVTHCGWNSTLESLWFGVPVAAWPLYAEQHLNAHQLTKEMGLAVEVRTDRIGGNTATAAEVERAVRCLMGEESWEVRKKAKEMAVEGRKTLEEGGPSFLHLQKLAEEMTSGLCVLGEVK